MPTLRGTHAEHVGPVVVEPGQPIPDNADPAIVARLRADGLIADDPKPKPKSKPANSEE